jgi:hypothetical protein
MNLFRILEKKFQSFPHFRVSHLATLVHDSIQALSVDYRILIRICGFNEILIKTLLAPETIFGRVSLLLRTIEFYQSSAGLF